MGRFIVEQLSWHGNLIGRIEATAWDDLPFAPAEFDLAAIEALGRAR
jgi:hypothetical protein